MAFVSDLHHSRAYSSSSSLLTGGSLVSNDSVDNNSSNVTLQNGASGSKTDVEIIGDLVTLLVQVREEISCPRYRKILGQCELLLTETPAKLPFATGSEHTGQDDFVFVSREDLTDTSGSEKMEQNGKDKRPSSIRTTVRSLFNFKEKKNYREIGSSSDSDPRWSGSCEMSANDQSNLIAVPEANGFPKASCAILRVLKTCELCDQLVDESLCDETTHVRCIACHENVPISKIEQHISTHSFFDKFTGRSVA